jgi:hypothetical protein
MKKEKDRLSHKQYAILQQQQRDTAISEQWLRSQGIESDSCIAIDLHLLKAKKLANEALNSWNHLMTAQQSQTLKTFSRQMNSKKARSRLTATQLNRVFAIVRQLRRQVFKQRRQIARA